jgi:hypothetical protein
MTLITYCNAIKQQDFATAYSQVSSSVKSQRTEAQFASSMQQFLKAGGSSLARCSVSNVASSGANAAGTITFTSTSGKIAVIDFVLVDENGLWRLESEQPRVFNGKATPAASPTSTTNSGD